MVLYERYKIQHVVQFTSKTDLFHFFLFKDTKEYQKQHNKYQCIVFDYYY